MNIVDLLKTATYSKHEILGGYKQEDVVDEYYCYSINNLNITTKKEKTSLFKELDKFNISYTPYYLLNTLVSINFNCTKNEFEKILKEI